MTHQIFTPEDIPSTENGNCVEWMSEVEQSDGWEAISTPLIAFGQPLFGILGWGLSTVTIYIALMKPLTRSSKPIEHKAE